MAEPIERILAHEDPFDFCVALFERAAERVESGGFDTLNEAERAAFCIYALDAEVVNGGFDQYLFNPSGDYAEETVAELRRVGAHRTAALLEEAMAAFGASRPSKDWLERQGQMEALDSRAEQQIRRQDDRYYRGEENPLALLRAFVLSRASTMPWRD